MNTIQHQFRRRLVVLVTSTVLAIAGCTWAINRLSAKETDAKAFKVALDETPIARGAGSYNSFAPIVKKVAPAVVKVVTTSQKEKVSAEDWPDLNNNPLFRRFFGGGQFSPHIQPPHQTEHALGSGVIITPDGYILTNDHVVDGAKEVQVTLENGREYTAKVIGKDSKSDLAVIKIDASNLPTIPMADSSKVQVGDIVLAIGNPFGVGQTVTQGIVSALNRGGMGIEDYENFIQTDAPINPGNSGGALVDVDGRLIGINTAILSRSGGNQGIGFAIPSDLAQKVTESLVKYGHVTRGYLGVMVQNVTPALASEFKVKEGTGALVSEVVPDGPAAKAGLKDGDVIVELNGKKVTDAREVKLAAGDTKPGTTVPVKIMRDGNPQTLEVTLKELPGKKELASNNNSNEGEKGTLKGVGVTDLNKQEREEMKIPTEVNGALVSEVRPGSAAAEAGLKEGDVIEQINKHPVSNAEEAVKLTENAKHKKTLLLVWSNGGSHFMVVDESKAS